MAVKQLQKPYLGKDPYIFISYAHRNQERVLDIIARLQADGYRVWYDEGIEPCTDWADNIAEHVIGCAYFIAFISQQYLLSDNCKEELNYARDQKKPRLLIYLEDVTLSSGMSMRSSMTQGIHMYRYREQEAFYEKLYSAKGIGLCLREKESSGMSAAQASSGDASLEALPDRPEAPAAQTPVSEEREWERLLSRDLSGNSEAALLLGRHHVKNGEDYEAIDCFVTALEGQETDALGELLALADRFDAKNEDWLWEKCCKAALDSWYVSEQAQELLLQKAQELDALGDRTGAIKRYKLLTTVNNGTACMTLAKYCEDGYRDTDPNITAKALYRRAAFLADIDASLWMAEHVDGHYGGAENQPGFWYAWAADLGDAYAMHKLGDLYLHGTGGKEQDPDLALQWYQSSADQGDADALRKLGDYYLRGFGRGDRDTARGVEYYHRAAEKGNTEAMLLLAQCHSKGSGLPKDPQEALRWYHSAADHGSTAAMVTLGDHYREEAGDPARSRMWYEQAAEAGDSVGCIRLWQYGAGERRILWLKKAAEQSHPEALRLLGLAYDAGDDVPQDPEEAVRCFTAAAQEDPQARYHLAVHLLEGNGVAPSPVQAVRWLKTEPRTQEAAVTLALCHAEGRGTKASPLEAFRLLRDLPCPNGAAQYQLGLFYRDGVGVSDSPVDAAYYLCQAMLEGHPGAEEAYRGLFSGKNAGKLIRAGFSSSVTPQTAQKMLEAVMKAEKQRYKRETSAHQALKLVGLASATDLPRLKPWYLPPEDWADLVPDSWKRKS